jgi:hypothetical protein
VITGYTALSSQRPWDAGFEVMIHADLAAKDLTTVEAFENRLAAMDEVANRVAR